MIKKRTDIAEQKIYELRRILIHPSLSRNLKLRIVKSTIIPIALYGCETWENTNNHTVQKCFNKLNRIIYRYLSSEPYNYKFKLKKEDQLFHSNLYIRSGLTGKRGSNFRFIGYSVDVVIPSLVAAAEASNREG